MFVFLFCCCKIPERVLCEQIFKNVNQFNILDVFQSGFRQLYSTEKGMIYLTDFFKREIDRGKYCRMTMFDLQKSFYTVNHQMLLYKLKAVGFNGEALKRVESVQMVENSRRYLL